MNGRNICLLYMGRMAEMYEATAPLLDRTTPGTWWHAMVQDWTAHSLFGTERLQEALAFATEAQAFWERNSDYYGMIWSLEALAGIARAEGRLDEARDRYRRLLEVNQQLDFRRGLLHTLNNLGLTSLAMGDAAAAEGYLIDGLRLSTETGQAQESLAALCDIANARTMLGDISGALRLVDAVIAHPASDQHQRYNPQTMREIAQQQHQQLVEQGAQLDSSAPLPKFEEIVTTLLEGSESLRAASST